MATDHNQSNDDLVLELPTDVRSIEHAVEYVLGRCPQCSQRAHRLDLNFRVGLTEALSNAMLYGNHRDPSKRSESSAVKNWTSRADSNPILSMEVSAAQTASVVAPSERATCGAGCTGSTFSWMV